MDKLASWVEDRQRDVEVTLRTIRTIPEDSELRSEAEQHFWIGYRQALADIAPLMPRRAERKNGTSQEPSAVAVRATKAMNLYWQKVRQIAKTKRVHLDEARKIYSAR